MSNSIKEVRNYVGGRWMVPTGAEMAEVWNPADGDVIAKVRSSSPDNVDRAVAAASAALPTWRRTSPNERAQWLYRLKAWLEDRMEDLARCITEEHGKLLTEARGEVRRAIDNVEMACGTPANLHGRFAEDIAAGVDEMMIRQPVGVCTAIAPFNFRFRYETEGGNIGITVGVAQPMSSFPFSGWGDSFFGDLHSHGHHVIEFFTQTKVVVGRWP